MKLLLRNILMIALAAFISLVIQRILKGTNIIDSNSLLIDFLSYVVIFFVIYGVLDFKKLYEIISKR